jgi:hypothetical protein
VRSLGRRGLEVHVAWCPLDAPALRSRHIHSVHRLPAYSPSNRRWLDALLHLLRSTPFDLVLPCHDSGLLPLHAHRAEVEAHAPLAIPGEEAFRVFFSKAETYNLARDLGIALPRQAVVRSLQELEAAVDRFGLPLVLKPQSSVAIDNPSARFTVRKLRLSVTRWSLWRTGRPQRRGHGAPSTASWSPRRWSTASPLRVISLARKRREGTTRGSRARPRGAPSEASARTSASPSTWPAFGSRPAGGIDALESPPP